MALDETLRWPAFPGATSYNVYVWQYGSTQPTNPTATTLWKMYKPAKHFSPTQQILWQIEYIVDGVLFPSPIWGFTTRSYANLAVTQIILPETAFSGQSFDIQWKVENRGSKMLLVIKSN